MRGLVELSACRHSLNVKLIEGRPLRETPFRSGWLQSWWMFFIFQLYVQWGVFKHYGWFLPHLQPLHPLASWWPVLARICSPVMRFTDNILHHLYAYVCCAHTQYMRIPTTHPPWFWISAAPALASCDYLKVRRKKKWHLSLNSFSSHLRLVPPVCPNVPLSQSWKLITTSPACFQHPPTLPKFRVSW